MSYRTWLDSKVDPALGVTGFRYIWNQHWIIVLHTAVVVAIMIALEWLFSIEPESTLYYLFGAAMIVTPIVTIISLWTRRAKLWSRVGEEGMPANG